MGTSAGATAAIAACGLEWLGASASVARAAGTELAAGIEAATSEPLEYRASTGCPDRGWVEARLHEAEVPQVLRPARARLALEVIGNPGRDFQGTAFLETALGGSLPPWRRQITGARCEDVLSALIVSLSIQIESSAVAEPPLAGPVADDAAAAQRWGTDGAEVDPAANPATPAERAALWRIGAALGGQARTHLGPGVDLGMRLGVTSDRAAGDGHRQSYALVLSGGRGAAAGLPEDLGALEWKHHWWALGVEGCRWGVALGDWLRVEPCAGVHGGRYTATIVDGTSRAEWLGFAEITARVGLDRDDWRGRLVVGGFVPFDPLSVRRESRSFYQIGAGVVVGVELAIAPLTL